MRAFVGLRRIATSLPIPDIHADIAQLRKEFEEMKLDIEDILHDQNDINESTRAQLDAISTALAELQAKEPSQRPRRKIGFVQEEEKWKSTPKNLRSVELQIRTNKIMNEAQPRFIAAIMSSSWQTWKKHNEQYSAIDFVQLPHKNHDRFLITLPLCSGFKRKKGFYMTF